MKPIEFAREMIRSITQFIPTILSLLDVDYYKFTMGQFIFRHYCGVHVTFKLIIRSKDMPVGKYISEKVLREHLAHAMGLRFTAVEIDYLRAKGIFGEDYLAFLRGFRLPPYQLKKIGDEIELTFSGPWETVTMWETIALAMISELFYRALLQDLSEEELTDVYARAQEKIRAKIQKLLLHPNVCFSDFGLRRRHSMMWQKWVVELCRKMMWGQFVGTSNVWLAQQCNLPSIGTNAHELQQTITALAGPEDDMRAAPYRFMKDWFEMYGVDLAIILSDTYTSPSFFASAPDFLAAWRGVRQDSGDPFDEGNLYIKWFSEHGVDPMDKVALFTDGLDVDPMIELEEYFRGRIMVGFGWGTLLTNDFSGCYVCTNETVLKYLKPFSMVCKVVEADGRPCVKLSNNPSKATGPKDEVERYKRVFGVGEQTAQAVIV